MKLKKFMVGMMLAATTVSMLGEALARPMGGGRSFGRQSQNVGRQAPAPAPTPAPAATPRQAQPAPAPAPAPAAKAPSRWKGLLGGALLGLGLGEYSAGDVRVPAGFDASAVGVDAFGEDVGAESDHVVFQSAAVDYGVDCGGGAEGGVGFVSPGGWIADAGRGDFVGALDHTGAG